MFKGGDAHVSTNSIHNALFARTCMMSRTAYKGLRIDWYPDECAGPLPQPQKSRNFASPVRPGASKPVATINPYNLLNADGSDTSSDDDEASSNDGVRVTNWAD